MYFNVSQQLKEGTGAVRSYVIEETASFVASGEEYPVAGVLEFLCVRRSILVTGELRTRVTEVCSRCLEKYPQSLDLKIEEEYFPVRDVDTGVSVDRPEEAEEGFTIDERFTLDLREAVRQAIILAGPMHPLCKLDCRGLCPECGHNLNLGECDCPASYVDPRWETLGSILAKVGNSD